MGGKIPPEILEEVGICGCSAYTLILGRLWFGPTSREELDELAKILYDNRRSCWSLEDYKVVMGFLLYSGMVKEDSNGELRLNLRDPLDVEYAKLASKSCEKVYRALGGEK